LITAVAVDHGNSSIVKAVKDDVDDDGDIEDELVLSMSSKTKIAN